MNNKMSYNINLFGYNKFFKEIKSLFDQNKLPNKIIFSGETGIGKSTFVYHLINYIFSKNEKYRYDYEKNLINIENKSYNLINKNSHPNFFLVSNNEDKLNIQISKIREMIKFTNKSSFNNFYKIILIDNIENLNISSVNAILKVIEEPNNKILFFLIHDKKKKILNTLNSRCIKFNMFLHNDVKLEIIKKVNGDDFFLSLNDDFKNFYISPGNIFFLKNFFLDNSIDPSTSIDDLINIIIKKSLYKKDFQINEMLPFFFELYFMKKFSLKKSKTEIYRLYKYFLKKLYSCNKFNLDTESVLIEFHGIILNE